MTPDRLTSQHCYDAAAYIAEHGHAKFIQRDSEGRACLAGALVAVGWDQWCQNHDILKEAIEAIDPHPLFSPVWAGCFVIQPEDTDVPPDSVFGQGLSYAVAWNNARCRTGEDVILMFKHAGHILEEREKAEEQWTSQQNSKPDSISSSSHPVGFSMPHTGTKSVSSPAELIAGYVPPYPTSPSPG